MTDKHIPASKLLALPTYQQDWRGDLVPERGDNVPHWVKWSDLDNLIDEAPEVEPVEYQIRILGERWTHCAKHLYDPTNPNTRALYTSPPPSTDLTKLVGELVEAFDLEVEKLRADRQNYWDKGSDRWLEADTCCNKFIGIARYLLDKVKGIIG